MTTTTGASVDGGTMTTTKAEEETSRDAMWAALSAVTPERCEEMREREGGEARARARGGNAGKSARRAGERRRAILSEPCAVPVVRFGAVDVGRSSAETLEIVNDTALMREVTFREGRRIRARRIRDR